MEKASLLDEERYRQDVEGEEPLGVEIGLLFVCLVGFCFQV